jgi:hypothetical protein
MEDFFTATATTAKTKKLKDEAVKILDTSFRRRRRRG